MTTCEKCEKSVKRRKYCRKCHRYLCKDCYGFMDYCSSCYGRLAFDKGHQYERMLYTFYKKALRKLNKRIIESGVNYPSEKFEIDVYFRLWGIWLLIEAKNLVRPMNYYEVEWAIKSRFKLFRKHNDSKIIGVIESKKGYTKDAYEAAQYKRYPVILAQNFIRKKRYEEGIYYHNIAAVGNQLIRRLFRL